MILIMASVLITNLTASAVHLSDLYFTLAASGTLTVDLPLVKIQDMPQLMSDVQAGNLSLEITPTAGEIHNVSATRTIRAELDASDGLAIGTHAFGPNLPDNAIITRCFYSVTTTFTSATDAGTIALGVASDDAAGLLAAVAISDVGDPYDAGLHATLVAPQTVTTFTTITTDERQLVAVVAVEALTAGKLIAFADYVIAE